MSPHEDNAAVHHRLGRGGAGAVRAIVDAARSHAIP